MSHDRSQAREVAGQTVRILEAGRYQVPTGAVVEIGDLLQRAVAGTRSYPPGRQFVGPFVGDKETRLEVVNESTLTVARRLVEEGHRPMALNFASAKHPGGGFLNGAQAQEESLARVSGLYACLVGNPMYEMHRATGDPMYTNYAIYSPDVPVIRDEEARLLAEPFCCAFITAPAVNAKVVLERDPSRRPLIRVAMQERIHRVLAIAASHGHEALVLGAWGCGVFGNDCAEIAELFHGALTEPFQGAFTRVVFAILDGSEDLRFIGPFRRRFTSAK